MQAHNCERATEILQSYLSAPKLYRTSDSGEREFLSEDGAVATIVPTRDKIASLCSYRPRSPRFCGLCNDPTSRVQRANESW